MRIRELRATATIAGVMVVLEAFIVPAIMGWAWFAPESYDAIVTPIAAQVDLWSVVFTVATMIVFTRWIYLAGVNLIAAGHEDLDFTPASRIWWFAVPIANLIKPFHGMRELWNASHGEQQYDLNHSLITVWWALWLANGILNWVMSFVAKNGDVSPALWVVQGLLGLASAAAGLALLAGITRAQSRPSEPDLVEVFA